MKNEFVSRIMYKNENIIGNGLELMKKRGFVEEVNNKIRFLKGTGMASVFLCSFVWPIIDTYWGTLVFCSAICKNQEIQYEKIQQSVQWFLENMFEERTLSFYESCSQYSIKHALISFEKMGIIDVKHHKNRREVTLCEKHIENIGALEEFLNHIARFRKISMVRKVGAHHEIRRALLAEFPKL